MNSFLFFQIYVRMKRRKDVDTEKCICHFADNDGDGSFTFLRDVNDPLERLEYLQQIKRRRLAQPDDSSERFLYACSLIPEEVEENSGYHPACYRRFTSMYNKILLIWVFEHFTSIICQWADGKERWGASHEELSWCIFEHLGYLPIWLEPDALPDSHSAMLKYGMRVVNLETPKCKKTTGCKPGIK